MSGRPGSSRRASGDRTGFPSVRPASPVRLGRDEAPASPLRRRFGPPAGAGPLPAATGGSWLFGRPSGSGLLPVAAGGSGSFRSLSGSRRLPAADPGPVSTAPHGRIAKTDAGRVVGQVDPLTPGSAKRRGEPAAGPGRTFPLGAKFCQRVGHPGARIDRSGAGRARTGRLLRPRPSATPAWSPRPVPVRSAHAAHRAPVRGNAPGGGGKGRRRQVARPGQPQATADPPGRQGGTPSSSPSARSKQLESRPVKPSMVDRFEGGQ